MGRGVGLRSRGRGMLLIDWEGFFLSCSGDLGWENLAF
jgi:hypothetical protein